MILYKELTDEIINCLFSVYEELGYGFLENVYEKALIPELELNDIKSASQVSIDASYKNAIVGKYFADILVENKVILELKATPFKTEHTYQILNYLKATEIEVGYLLSFGKKPKFERFIFSNDFKR